MESMCDHDTALRRRVAELNRCRRVLPAAAAPGLSVRRRAHPYVHPDSALRMEIKRKNDTMGPTGLLPTLMVFGALPFLPGIQTDVPSQRYRIDALITDRDVMVTIVAPQRISPALTSQLAPATIYVI